MKDPEAKRKIIGAGFIEVFDEYAARLQKELGSLPRFLVQVCCSHFSHLAGSAELLHGAILTGRRFAMCPHVAQAALCRSAGLLVRGQAMR